MPVKLSAIEGLMIEKVNEDQKYRAEIGEFNMGKKIGYNKAIDFQGSKKIGLNRERLAYRLALNTHKNKISFEEFKRYCECNPSNGYLKDADAIIREEATLLEYKPNAI